MRLATEFALLLLVLTRPADALATENANSSKKNDKAAASQPPSSLPPDTRTKQPAPDAPATRPAPSSAPDAPTTRPAPSSAPDAPATRPASPQVSDRTAMQQGSLQPPITVDVGGLTTQPGRSAGHTTPIEVHVRGASAADRLEATPDAVRVVPMPSTRAVEVTDVLARTEGITVARMGGLGSASTVRLAGFGGEQVRFFLDGIPLELSGYPFGIGTVPIGLIEHVEIYRGVVPPRFGTDALGGAVQLTSERLTNGSGLSTSFELGAFGTYRWSLVGARRDRERKIYQRIESYVDTAENDYPVTVDAPDSSGRLVRSRVHRFHDGYQAKGLAFETGMTGRRYADRLAVRTFVSSLDKELQHNPTMTVPYGDVSYAKRSFGTNVRYAKRLGAVFEIRGHAGYSARLTDFEDLGNCAYDWFGRCVRSLSQPGEIGPVAIHRRTLQSDVFSNVEFKAALGPGSELSWIATPRWLERRGSNRLESDSAPEDPATFPQRSASFVNALVFQSKTEDDALQGNLFIKSFLQHARATEALPAGGRRVRLVDHRPFGMGASVRYAFQSWGFAKAGYEWSARLPAADEWFGDGVLISANTRLRPERSHNANVTFGVNAETPKCGVVSLESTGFVRRASELIVLLGDGTGYSNQNIARARGIGVEGRARWSSPAELLRISVNVTWQDLRNDARAGAFAPFEGDRIPNRPYLTANLSPSVALRAFLVAEDELTLGVDTSYVHRFYRSWESLGDTETKAEIPSQLVHSAFASYRVKTDAGTLTQSLEVINLTDEARYDYFGVQRPPRAAYVKWTLAM